MENVKLKTANKVLTADDKFMKNMRTKFETKKVDEPSIKNETMESLLEGILQVPEKLHMVSSPDRPSAKKQKPEENQLQTGPGRNFSESTMDDKGKVR